MSSAVSQAHELSRNGDVVVLSPGCTSYDWYSNYGERGDDFMNCVRELSENHH
jgi:UDP-N-acetylmuramoylalanine--D-glutamate ligase